MNLDLERLSTSFPMARRRLLEADYVSEEDFALQYPSSLSLEFEYEGRWETLGRFATRTFANGGCVSFYESDTLD